MEKNMIIESKQGKVKINGKSVCKLPTNRSIFSQKSFVQGGDYTIDPDWIYVDGKPVQKQLNPLTFDGSKVNVWMPNVSDIKKLEARYWKVKEAKRAYFQKSSKYFKAIAKKGIAHAKVTHKYEGDLDPWWEYKYDGMGIGFNWIDEPKDPVNFEDGMNYYLSSFRTKDFQRRCATFYVALAATFIKKLDELTGSKHGVMKDFKYLDKQICFIVNGHRYFFHAVESPRLPLTVIWEILSWPTDSVQIVDLDV
jgi:hypothetical protein